jgi:hypothetical protein
METRKGKRWVIRKWEVCFWTLPVELAFPQWAEMQVLESFCCEDAGKDH